MNFPYLVILKQAYELARKYLWLWIFGLFIGSTLPLNFGGWNFRSGPFNQAELEKLKAGFVSVQDWTSSNQELFFVLVALTILFFLMLIILQGLSTAAVIWSTNNLAREQKPGEVNFKTALKQARGYLWRIIGLQILITIAFFLLLVLFGGPIIYLLSLGAKGRAIFLAVLGLAIFIPASIVFGFIHLYGPIFIVLFHRPIGEAIQLSFNLVRQKLKESIILAAFLLGLRFLFMIAVGFSIIILAVPTVLFSLFLSWLGLGSAMLALIISAAVVAILYFIALVAGFNAFQYIVWVLAMKEMIRTRKIKEEKKVLAPEPV